MRIGWVYSTCIFKGTAAFAALMSTNTGCVINLFSVGSHQSSYLACLTTTSSSANPTVTVTMTTTKYSTQCSHYVVTVPQYTTIYSARPTTVYQTVNATMYSNVASTLNATLTTTVYDSVNATLTTTATTTVYLTVSASDSVAFIVAQAASVKVCF
jgi:hypothetical protein